jgi:hypothetical protein
VGEGSISSLNRSARASRQILIKINSIIYNYILRIDSKKNTGLRKLKCGMWVPHSGQLNSLSGSRLKLKEAIRSEDDGVVVCDNKHELEIRNTILILYKL